MKITLGMNTDSIKYKLLSQVTDQILHCGWAVMVLAPLAIWPHWWMFIICAFLIDLPREMVDQWPINRAWDTALDLIFFGVGGFLVGWFLL